MWTGKRGGCDERKKCGRREVEDEEKEVKREREGVLTKIRTEKKNGKKKKEGERTGEETGG